MSSDVAGIGVEHANRCAYDPMSVVNDSLVKGHSKEDRLTIFHLLCWMFGTAIVLAANPQLGPQSQKESTVSPQIEMTLRVCSAIVYGAAVGSLGVWIAARRRGKRFPKSPGEVLLVVMGLTTALFTTMTSITSINPDLWELVVPVWFTISALSYTLAAYVCRHSFAYSVFFVLTATVHGIVAASPLFMPLDSAWSRILIGVLCLLLFFAWICSLPLAVLLDFMRRTPRGWMHWVGVGVAASFVLIILVRLGFRFL
jgi:hypothetical protein